MLSFAQECSHSHEQVSTRSRAGAAAGAEAHARPEAPRARPEAPHARPEAPRARPSESSCWLSNGTADIHGKKWSTQGAEKLRKKRGKGAKKVQEGREEGAGQAQDKRRKGPQRSHKVVHKEAEQQGQNNPERGPHKAQKKSAKEGKRRMRVPDAALPRALEECVRADDVVVGEGEAVAERVLDVRVRSCVHDRVDGLAVHQVPSADGVREKAGASESVASASERVRQ
eukprot:6213209-Pleurochrysis_carterae.AAC.7